MGRRRAVYRKEVKLSKGPSHVKVHCTIARKYNKQVLDEVFVISKIIKVKVGVISQSPRQRLITLTNNCFTIN